MFFVCVSIWCVGGKFHSLFPLSFHAFSLYVCVRGLHFDVLDKKIFLPYFRSTLASFVVVSLLYSSFLFIALLPRVRVFVKVFWHLLLSCFLYEFSFYFLPVSLATSLGCCCFYFPPLYLNFRWKECYWVTIWSVIQFNYGFKRYKFFVEIWSQKLSNEYDVSGCLSHTVLCVLKWKINIILLFSLFLLLFMNYTVLFCTIYKSYYTILINFYIYLQYLQQ